MGKTLTAILAGGKGERLWPLTEYRAKPAVPFAGNYRIADFPLSNTINSGLKRVYVITQYQPNSLDRHLNQIRGYAFSGRDSLRVLPPIKGSEERGWYEATANAIYQNLDVFKTEGNYDNMLILAGDHIYLTDFKEFIEQHEKTDADFSIMTQKVPDVEKRKQLGVLDFDSNKKITDFQEKSNEPKYENASMGIYLAKREFLEKILKENSENPKLDFGGDVIPQIIKDKKGVYAFPYKGYWRDVGTLKSYFEANMDLLAPNPDIDLQHATIWTYGGILQPFVKQNFTTALCGGCIVSNATLENVIAGSKTQIEKSDIKNTIFLGSTWDTDQGGKDISKAYVGKDCKIQKAIFDKDVTVGDGCIIGYGNEDNLNGLIPGIDYICDKDSGLIVIKKGRILKPGTIISAIPLN